MYAEIDKNSNLLWPVKDEFELIGKNLTRGCRGTRSGTKKEDKQGSIKWQNETNASFGYGEITRVSNFYFFQHHFGYFQKY